MPTFLFQGHPAGHRYQEFGHSCGKPAQWLAVWNILPSKTNGFANNIAATRNHAGIRPSTLPFADFAKPVIFMPLKRFRMSDSVSHSILEVHIRTTRLNDA